MGLSLSLRNKVARRILLSFVLAALVPIGVTGLLSFREVNGELQAQAGRTLRFDCKDYGLQLLQRLKGFESALRLAAFQLKLSGSAKGRAILAEEGRRLGQFSALAVAVPRGEKTALMGNPAGIPDLTEAELSDIASGKTVIKGMKAPTPADRRLWMALALDEQRPTDDILLGELRPESVWLAENVEPDLLWVVSDTGVSWFASDPGLRLSPAVGESIARENSGEFEWNSEAGGLVGAFWKLPLKNLYSAPDITIVEARPAALVFLPMRQFSAVYPPVIVLAVLIVAYLSTKLIGKYLTPLERLRAATLRLAEGDFDSPLAIRSRDEFQLLGDSFDTMRQRLRHQFHMLSTMAEIDRHILSALDAEEIVETALRSLPPILGCDLISIARLEPDAQQLRDMRSRRDRGDTEIFAEPLSLAPRDLEQLRAVSEGSLEVGPGGQLPGYLQVLGVSGDWRFLLVPILVKDKLSAVVSLGFRAPNPISPGARSAARGFGDRIAVALSNAAWEEKLFHQAHYDAVTGLPNRLVLNDQLSQDLTRARLNGSQVAVCFVDLDRFKNVNDSLGHAAGDELLLQIARFLRDAVRETDLVVRVGGDEFVVVLADLHPDENPVAFIGAVAEKILANLKQTLVVAGRPMSFTASLGIAIFPEDADNPSDLLKNADAAMYQAKADGRALFRFYSKELNASALENMELEHELRNAIARGELQLYYQPKVDQGGEIVGAEALIRWRHRERGMISPARFIPLAEQSGLIVDIGEWVFEQACLWVNAYMAKGFKPLRLSVNLSAIEFRQPKLVAKLADILARTGANPRFLELEITESVAIGDVNVCIARMNDLKALGLTLSMDDFGTGFSSLSYLRDLPLDVLKIDQSFVRGLESKSNNQAIVKTILALASGLDMVAIAEGVETEAQFQFLKEHDCGDFQGYLFSRPLPSEEFMQWLEARSQALELQG